jgi:predicted SnoaL-like aldol condensation-catalyzing enzyme
MASQTRGDAIVDIFRLENRKIVEQRDVMQSVPETAPTTTLCSDSETNKDIAVAFYKKALFEGRVEHAFRLYA